VPKLSGQDSSWVKFLFIFLCLLILCLGVGVRVYGIFQNNSFDVDEIFSYSVIVRSTYTNILTGKYNSYDPGNPPFIFFWKKHGKK